MMDYFKKKGLKWNYLLVLLIIGFCLRIFLTDCYYWDESIYLQHAEIFSGKINNYNEFELRPPILSLIFAGLYSVWHNPLIANLFVSFISAFSILVIYWLAKEIFDENTGFIAAIIFTFWPLHIYLSRQLLVHTTALCFGMLFLLFLKKGENNSRNYWFFLSGIFLALSIMTRFTYLILIPVLALNYLLFFRKYSISSILSFGVGFAIFILPYLVWVKAKFGDFFYTFKMARLVTDWSSHEPFNFYLITLPIVLSLIGIIGIILWMFFKIKDKKISKNEILFIILFLLPFIYLSYMPHKEVRFMTITIMSLAILAALGFKRLYELIENRKVLVKTAVVLFFVILIFSAVIFLQNYNTYPRQCNSDVEFVSEWINANVPINNTIYVQDFYPYFAYYTQNKIVIAPLARERFFSYKQFFNETGYFIYFEAQNQNPSFPSLSQLQNDSRFTLFEELKNKERVYIFSVNKL